MEFDDFWKSTNNVETLQPKQAILSAPITTQRAAGFELLKACALGDLSLTRKAGSFCGQLVADDAPMSTAQAEWLVKLLDRAGFEHRLGGVTRPSDG